MPFDYQIETLKKVWRMTMRIDELIETLKLLNRIAMRIDELIKTKAIEWNDNVC